MRKGGNSMSERREKNVVFTEKAPLPVGPYSQGIIYGNTLYISGQIPIEPASSKIVQGIINQTHQVCKNLLAVASAGGASAKDFLKVTIFLTEMGNFPLVNQVYEQYFGREMPPARACVEVRALPKNVMIEMEAIVGLKEQHKEENDEEVAGDGDDDGG